MKYRCAYDRQVDIDSEEYAEVLGIEWDFLAVDAAGCVAVLSSAGSGMIPEQVIVALDDVELAMDQVNQLPTITTAVPVEPGRTGDYSGWFDVSSRGFYTYDWDGMVGRYVLIAAPGEPIRVESLPELIRFPASLLRISQLFAESLTLRLRGPG
jgi:hypothetical protein